MIVQADLTLTSSELELLELEDLRSLKVLVMGASEPGAALAETLAPLGRLDDTGHVFLDIEALKRAASALGTDETWPSAFDEMVRYARSKGWVSADGRALKAHCEWQPTGPEKLS